MRAVSRRRAAARVVACVLAAHLVAPAHGQESVPPAAFADPERRAKLARAFPELDAMARRWLEARGAPGVAWGIVIDGELARFGSTGVADVASRRPVTADTVFRIASMTKSFTALAILMLRDEGKLDLDSPASRYVPEMQRTTPPTRDAPPISVRQLLTHTAGFPEDNPWGDRQLAVSDEELSRWLAQGLPFSTSTGSGYEYSNYGFAILGRIVQNVSGMPYAEYMNRRILAPLGMTASRWDPREVPARQLATGYRKEGAGFIAEVPLAHGAFGAMGGLLTSSRDLARWVALMLSAWPPRDAPETPPAARRSIREMQQGAGYPALVARRSAPGAPLDASANVYGFGLRITRTCGLGTRVGHSGGLPGYGSYMEWLPEYGVGAFAMSNLTYGSPAPLVRELLSALEASGGLEARRPAAAPSLLAATRELTALVDAWSDERATRLAASNLFLDEPLERRRAHVSRLRRDLGACRAAPIRAENALRGTFRMECDRGWLDVTFTLAPTQPPAVQHLEVRGGRPPSPAMQQTLAAILRALTRGPQALDLAPGADRAAIGAMLAQSREAYGACRLGDVLDGDGELDSRVRLECDRGDLELRALRAAGGKLSAVELAPPADAICSP